MGKQAIVAIASSTGGPKALQSVIPKLPKDLPVPILLVQHMPAGFTASLASRLDSLSDIAVKEAKDGEVLKNGCVYVAPGGVHMHVIKQGQNHILHMVDGPVREGVKPCANFMYESLADSSYDYIVCVVMTGMGADGTEGIAYLKNKKKIHVITQNQETSTVYGMPRSAFIAGVSDTECDLDHIAQEITRLLSVNA